MHISGKEAQQQGARHGTARSRHSRAVQRHTNMGSSTHVRHMGCMSPVHFPILHAAIGQTACGQPPLTAECRVDRVDHLSSWPRSRVSPISCAAGLNETPRGCCAGGPGDRGYIIGAGDSFRGRVRRQKDGVLFACVMHVCVCATVQCVRDARTMGC